MKKLLSVILLLAAAVPVVHAQDTYLNDRVTNNSDVIGTARYVGMGGAMGALGADISVMSNNPAGIGLMRRGTISLTMGGLVQDEAPASGDNRAHFTFDQAGFVAVLGKGEENHFNFGFNYQKKINYNHSLLTSQALGGLSQGDMFAWIANGTYSVDKSGNYYFASPFYDNLYGAGFFSPVNNTAGKLSHFHNTYRGNKGYYYRNSQGALHGFDINFSGSIQERYYWGLTFGIDYMNYSHSADYEEVGDDSYILYQDQKLKGYGFNLKLGTVIRPVEDSPFRFGLAIESPTWYKLRHNAWAGMSGMTAGVYNNPTWMNDDNYLEYNIYTPWKFRASLGSTVDTYFAWDIEYEYSMNNYTKMGYPNGDDRYGNGGISMDKDRAMNQMTQNNVRGVHNIRAGFEVKPVPQFAIRAGYNFYSKPFKNGARLDQSCDSPAFDWSTSTDYINLGVTNILSVGIGFQGKHFYADLAYKYRMQHGDFYSFDDNFSSYCQPFIDENPALKDAQLTATDVNLNRHNFAITLGYRF